MNLPSCPNVKEGACPKSDLRLAGENQESWFFCCMTCFLNWMVSKPKTKERASWENRIATVKRMTDAERDKERRTKYFVMGGR